MSPDVVNSLTTLLLDQMRMLVTDFHRLRINQFFDFTQSSIRLLCLNDYGSLCFSSFVVLVYNVQVKASFLNQI